jgi:hypothetical protein
VLFFAPRHIATYRELCTCFNDQTGRLASIPASTFSTDSDVPCIPASINSLSKLAAARFYHGTLNFAVHALVRPDRGDSRHRATTLDYVFTKAIGSPRAKLLSANASDHLPLEISVPVAELAD